MKQLCFWMAMTILLFTSSSCEKIVGEGPVVTETRTAPAFEGLSVSVPAEAYFTQSPDYNITLQAQQNILDEIETVVSGGVLKIRFRHNNTRIRNHEKITVRVSGPMARLLELNGSGSLRVEGLIDPAEAHLYVSGSGSIHADEIQSNKIKIISSGSGRITVDEGSANEENITISGSAHIRLGGVQVKDADCFISGSGDMEIHATDNLKVTISGSGNVYYKGSPAINSQISGSGSVVKM